MTETQATSGAAGTSMDRAERDEAAEKAAADRAAVGRATVPADKGKSAGDGPDAKENGRGDRPPVTASARVGAGASGRAGVLTSPGPAAPAAPGSPNPGAPNSPGSPGSGSAGSGSAGSGSPGSGSAGSGTAAPTSTRPGAAPNAPNGRSGRPAWPRSAGRAHRSMVRRPRAPVGSPRPYAPRGAPSRPPPPVVRAGPACS